MFHLKTLNLGAASLALLVAGIFVGCSQTSTKSPDVSVNIRQSLDQAGLKGVSVSLDREKGVVTRHKRNPLQRPSLADKLSQTRLQ
jgi:hypothetical protein